jgi:hypothetical protein
MILAIERKSLYLGIGNGGHNGKMEKAGNGLLQAFQACDDGPAICQQVKEYTPRGQME